MIAEYTLIPGNGCEYSIAVSRRQNGSLLLCLFSDKTKWSGSCLTMLRDNEYEYHPSYVAEKLKCSIADAACVLAFMRAHYNINVYLETKYNQTTGVWIGEEVQ